MKTTKIRQTTHELFILGSIIAKTTMHSTQRHGILADAGISMLQYGVLRRLPQGDLTIAELSKVMIVDPSTLVSVIDSLTRKGFAERKRDPNDRRRTPISITQKGLDIVRQHPDHGPFSAEDNALVKSLEAMGEEKAQQLLDLMREVVFHMPEGAQILEHVANRVQYHEAEINKGNHEIE